MGSLFRRRKPKQKLAEHPVHLSETALDEFLERGEYFPRPHWAKISELVYAQPAEFRDLAWKDVAWLWASRLSERLGSPYSVHWSSEFLMLSAFPEKKANRLLQTLEGYREKLFEVLGREEESDGYYTVFVFANQDDYYRYVSFFHPDGEQAGSGGSFIGDEHYGHLVTFDQEMYGMEVTLAHELTHYMVWPSSLPLWLEEGLCQSMEGYLAVSYHRPINAEVAGAHREYWEANGLEGFWQGESFRSVGGQELSYELARILFQVLAERKKGNMAKFLAEAHWKDSGMSACEGAFGISLDEVATRFLGPGDWKPRSL